MNVFYFAEIGENSATLISYFENNGADRCPLKANPAEWMLNVIGAAPGSQTTADWPKVWRDSSEYQSNKTRLHKLQISRNVINRNMQLQPSIESNNGSYAASFLDQWWFVQKRIAAQYWRVPTYIYSKIALTLGSVSIHLTQRTCVENASERPISN